MKMKTIGLLTAAALLLTACGVEEGSAVGVGDVSPPQDPKAPVLQITSEGGFAPVELVLGRGPRVTLLADRSLIYEGPMIEIYPQPLVPNYQVGNISEAQFDEVMRLVEEVGLPDFTEERDDQANQNVADATTEVVTFWDSAGAHTYSVYALGINPSPSEPKTAAFLKLFNYVLDLPGSIDAEPYTGEAVQVIAGPGFADPEFPDVRDWPLESDTSDWTVLPNEWQCTTDDPAILDLFGDATWNTQWTPADDGEPLKLLVRPIHPGEAPCFGN